MKTLFIILLGSMLGALAAPQQPPLRFSLESFNLSLTNCFAEPGHVAIPLGITNKNIEVLDWTCAPASTNYSGKFELRLAKPMYVGSIITYGAENITYALSNDWRSAPTTEPPSFLLRVAAFPPDTLIDTIRIATSASRRAGQDGKPDQYQATLPFCTLIPARVSNIAGSAIVTTSSAAKRDRARPWLNRPQTLVDGLIHPTENFSSAPRESEISTNAPEWIMLTWQQVQHFRGMAVLRGSVDPGLGQSIAETFIGTGDPATATGTNNWKTFEGRASVVGQFRQHQWVVSFEPVLTRGLRLRTVGGAKQIGVGEILVLSEAVSPPAGAGAPVVPAPDATKKP